jgi:predicted hydrocarbon binding protein
MKITDLGAMDLATDPRATLGDAVPFFFYRYVTLFALADSLGARAKPALLEAGRKMGQQIVKQMHYMSFADLTEHYRNNGMGVLTVEKTDDGRYYVRLAECATCHGLPRVDMALCYLDAGILTAAISEMVGETGQSLPDVAEEVECVGLGDSSCLFRIPISPEAAKKIFK